jgi:predicted alpha/beta superfamily hydrolase
VFVSLPPSYAENPSRRYPVVYVTDADYGFPMLRLIGRRMNGEGPRVEEFILVGLSYATGENSMASRRRDYTPTPRGASSAPAGSVHGQSLAYRDYLGSTVIPFVEGEYRVQPGQRVFVGHSYGSLLGAQILLTQPDLFDSYILGSPSLWFDRRHLIREMPALLARQEKIDADVYLYAGEFEAKRAGDHRYNQKLDMVEDNRQFAELLEAKAYPELRLKAEVLEDEDHLSVAPRGFTRGLLHLLPAARGGQ